MPEALKGATSALPAPSEKTVAMIRSTDGTWHRPFTTLELAALQSLYDPQAHLLQADIKERPCKCEGQPTRPSFILDGNSDQGWRERIGNAVPPKAAKAVADLMGTTLLLAESGETFAPSSTSIWVCPVALALTMPAQTPL